MEEKGMNERKEKAIEIRKLFNKKLIPYLSIEAVLILIGFIGSRIISNSTLKIVGFIILGIIYLIVLAMASRIEEARKIIYCRILVGKEVSDNPVKEGFERLRKLGTNSLRKYRRECGRIMYIVVKGAMSIGNMMEQIPGLEKVSGIYKKLVKRLYEDCSKMLVTYQLGCYEEADQEQFYDLITYFIQDGKNFILKTVKSEAKRFVRAELNAIVICIGLLGYVYTKNIIFVVITIAFFIISLLLSYSNDELEILCDYIEYVQTHELDTELRDKIVMGVKTGNTVLDYTRVYRRNTEFSIKRDRNGRIHDDKLDTAENRL